MELKQRNPGWRSYGLVPLNRTLLELKLFLSVVAVHGALSLNRTLLELKREGRHGGVGDLQGSQSNLIGIETETRAQLLRYRLRLSIEPYWN